jgi:hypothetical protein
VWQRLTFPSYPHRGRAGRACSGKDAPVSWTLVEEARGATLATQNLMKLALVSLAIVSTCSFGCNGVGRQVRTTVERYEVGNYNAAARACYEVSDAEEDMNAKARVRYLVHCGLAHFHLGNRGEALDYLKQGVSEYSGTGRGNWLKPGTVDEAYKALDDLEGRSRERSRFPGRVSQPSKPLPAAENEAEEL